MSNMANHVKNLAPRVDHHALEGIIVAGSYNAAAGEVDVLVGDTGANQDDGQNRPVILKGLQLLTPAVGDQQGPVGDERCILVQRWSGYGVILEHGEDDSPAALAGERIIAPPGTNAVLHFKNGVVSLTVAEIDLIAASLLKMMTAQLNINASTGVHVTTPLTVFDTASFEISSGTITSTNGEGVKFVGASGSTAEPVLRVSDLLAYIAWDASHKHVCNGNGQQTTTPITAPPTISGSTDFSVG